MMPLEGFRADHACQIAQVSRAGFYRHYAEHEPREADVAVRPYEENSTKILSRRNLCPYSPSLWSPTC